MLGKRRLFDFAYGSLGLTHLDPERDNNLGPLVLGSQTHGVTPVQLANAYSVFRDGVYRPALYYTKVTLADGSTYLDPAQDSYAVQAVSPQTAYIMNRLLRGVLTAPGGTARGMAPAGEMEAAAKTGTTTDYRDFTFVGLTPYYVTAGWWGYDVPADLSQQGVRTGKPLQTLWRDYMQQGCPIWNFSCRRASLHAATTPPPDALSPRAALWDTTPRTTCRRSSPPCHSAVPRAVRQGLTSLFCFSIMSTAHSEGRSFTWK